MSARTVAHGFHLSLLLLGLSAGSPRATAEEAAAGQKVRQVRIEGEERLDRETILYYTTLKAGSTYDPEQARQDFRKLWDTGFFEDLRLTTEPAGDQIDVVWHVVERPVLERLSFSGNEGMVDADIKKGLKDRGIELREGSPFGLEQVERARGAIEALYRDKGYRFVKAESSVEPAPEGGKSVSFKIDEGSKVRIKTIEFEGNRAFSDGDLRGALKKTKQQGMFCFLTKHCVYSEPNFNEDLEKLQSYYWDRGYINMAMGEPLIDSEGTGKARRLVIRIPVTEGKRYRVGKVDVTGNTAYPKEALLSLNRLKTGDSFSRKRMDESRQDMSEVYGIKGYVNVLIVPQFETHDPPERSDGQGVVDVTYKITENELFYVHRIAFKGNTTTKDKVIRRQLRISEGDLFNTARFKRSLFRIYQLGYFKEPKPRIEPSKEDPSQLDVTIDLQEEGRNDIRLGGGYSGVEGFFGTFAFSTRNLFGTGNSLTVDVQSGKRVKQYQLSYVDPYIRDRPVSGGIDLFNRRIEYADFQQRGTGGELQLGYQIADFWFTRLAYRREDVKQRPLQLYDADGNPIPIDPIVEAQLTDNRQVSSLMPLVSYSSVDNPVRPWRGLRQVLSVKYSGGMLGGTTNVFKPRLDSTWYRPLSKRVGLGLHGEASWVEGFGGRDVPLFERFFLGGEQSVRGYPVYSISPRIQGNNGRDILLGGNKMLVLNAELQFRVASPVSLVLFADAGNAYDDDESISLSDLHSSYGAEIRFWTPFLQAPLRLIYSFVPKPLVRNEVRDPKTDFTFSIGSTF